jgi:SAM-dependent methyltransferase
MRNEGDVVRAREDYFGRRDGNLDALLRQRFGWMNRYLDARSVGADIGCGAGFSQFYLQAEQLWLTDYSDAPFLDLQFVDALRLPFRDGSLDFLVATNMIHHLPYPLRFFREAHRVLRPGGKLLLHDVHASLLMRAILRLMRHEGYSFAVDVFDETAVATDPKDPWSGNNAITRMLFADHSKFLAAAPGWKILRDEHCECLLFLNSGGVTAKTAYLPLPKSLLALVKQVDRMLCAMAPDLFALGRAIALEKVAAR